MINLIIISATERFCDTIRERLRDNYWKISFHSTFSEAQPLLASGIFDFCLIDAAPGLRQYVEKLPPLQSWSESCKFIAVAEAASTEEIEYAYNHGFDYVLPKPLQEGLLKTVLSGERHLAYSMPFNQPPAQPINNPSSSTPPPSLDIIRDFSRILSHSLDLPSLVRHFVLKVREIIGVNRVAIFLEDPQTGSPSAPQASCDRLQCICSVGIPADVQNCLELSKNSGLGQWATETGQILRADQTGSLLSPSENARVQHEFTVFGCQVAIPIVDRERTIGVAMLGGHITRIGFTDDELQLMFHLMEELGLSVKNNWLHNELAANHRLFRDVLSSMKNGSLVVGPELEILHANPAMLHFMQATGSPPGTLTFSSLPPAVAGRIHEVVENGEEVEPFYLADETESGKTFRVSIIPFQNSSRRLPQSAMVVLEDFTEVENAKKIAVEAANTKLTSLIAKRFAHEIRNSLVPLTTHLQLMDDRYSQPSFQNSLKDALETETARISRFTEQMLFLAEARPPPSVLTGVEKLLRESFAKAEASLRISGILVVDTSGSTPRIRCHPQGIAQAFQEIFINGLQAASAPEIKVTIEEAPEEEHHGFIRIGFSDNGKGFTEETARFAAEPFYTSRNTGIGLGLTVASKVAIDHGGWLDAKPRSNGESPDLYLYLPTDDSHE